MYGTINLITKDDSGGNAPEEPRASAHPTKWWQWILVYPAIVLGVIGAIPTAIEAVKSYRYGVPIFSSYEAEKQNELWVRNSDCLKDVELSPVKTKSNVEISTVVCASGDVLLVGKRPEWALPQKRWIAWSDIAPDSSQVRTTGNTFIRLFPQANAAEPIEIQIAQLGPMTVICQRWVANGLLLQRIGTPQGCVDQVVNTYNGWVVSSNPAPCDPLC